MDLEKEILELKEKVEENNKILRSIRNAKRFSNLMSFLYWTAVILAGLYTWSTIQPFLKDANDLLQKSFKNLENLNQNAEKIKAWQPLSR